MFRKHKVGACFGWVTSVHAHGIKGIRNDCGAQRWHLVYQLWAWQKLSLGVCFRSCLIMTLVEFAREPGSHRQHFVSSLLVCTGLQGFLLAGLFVGLHRALCVPQCLPCPVFISPLHKSLPIPLSAAKSRALNWSWSVRSSEMAPEILKLALHSPAFSHLNSILESSFIY